MSSLATPPPPPPIELLAAAAAAIICCIISCCVVNGSSEPNSCCEAAMCAADVAFIRLALHDATLAGVFLTSARTQLLVFFDDSRLVRRWIAAPNAHRSESFGRLHKWLIYCRPTVYTTKEEACWKQSPAVG